MIDAGANLPTGDQIGLDLDGDPLFVDSTLTGRVARSDIGADEFNLARLGLTGVPWPGNSLRFQVEGWYGARFLLSWSPSPASTLIQPYGHLLLGQPFVLAAGIVPRAIEVKVPAAPSLVGFDVFFQALVLTTYGTPPLPGAFTNRVDLTIGTRR
jgi:hypothetical protein